MEYVAHVVIRRFFKSLGLAEVLHHGLVVIRSVGDHLWQVLNND